MTITEELPVVETGGLIASRARLLDRVVPTEPNLPPICVQLGGPSACLPAAPDPFNAGRIIITETSIHQVLRNTRSPQVAPSIVAGDTVRVINIAVTPFACHHRIRDAMSRYGSKINAQQAVSATADAPCNFAGLFSKSLTIGKDPKTPAEVARLWIISQKFLKPIDRRKFARFGNNSHFALLRRMWLGPSIGVPAPTRPAFLAKILSLFNVRGATPADTRRIDVHFERGVSAGCWSRP